MSADFTLVDSAENLPALVHDIESCDSIAVDTEADSLHHYREKLCLIQVTASGRHWIVDPLAPGLDLSPLVVALARPEILFHGADYDLRLLHRTFGFCPSRVFDTMLAAQLLGWPQIGLAAAVERVCGVEQNKHGQRADWSRRPIPDKLLEYAADDTRYLGAVADWMRAALDQLGRLEWHRESCARVERNARVPPSEEIDPDAWRIKGGRHFRGRPAAVLRELWQWREDQARRLDRPPFKVLGSDYLLQWANFLVQHPHMPEDKVPGAPPGLRGARLEDFERTLARALTLPPRQWPGEPRPRESRGGGRRVPDDLIKRLLVARDEVARELGVDPGVVGPRDALGDLLGHALAGKDPWRAGNPLLAWQQELLRPRLDPVIEACVRDAGA